jgi:ketosteroid isomerase-like protein
MSTIENRKNAVLAAERAWAQAHLAFDLELITALMAPEYQRIDSRGNVLDKTETLRAYQDGPRRWLIAESADLDVRLFESIALVVGLWHGKGHNKGIKFDYYARFLAIYVEQGGKWLLAAEQSTPVSVNPAEFERGPGG